MSNGDQVTINGLIEGEISVERRAMIEATQMRKRTKLDPFSMKGFDELRLFRAVMDDDVDRLQDLIIKIASASPTDISSFRNGRGESLLEMARDRRKVSNEQPILMFCCLRVAIFSNRPFALHLSDRATALSLWRRYSGLWMRRAAACR